MEKQWYIIHTYSGFEKKVKESLESRVAAFGLQDKIGRMMIPTEDVLEVRGGKKVISSRMLYPGYVLVEMDMDDYTWHVVRNTPRVTGFVGSGETPTPLSETEVENILHRVTTSADRPKPKLVFERNEQVRIIEGPFANFTGVVDDVNADSNTVKVSVPLFGGRPQLGRAQGNQGNLDGKESTSNRKTATAGRESPAGSARRHRARSAGP